MNQPPSDHYGNDAWESAERIRTHAKASVEDAQSVTQRVEAGGPATNADSARLAQREQTLREHTEQLEAIRHGLGDAGLESGYIDGIEADVHAAVEVVRTARDALGRPE